MKFLTNTVGAVDTYATVNTSAQNVSAGCVSVTSAGMYLRAHSFHSHIRRDPNMNEQQIWIFVTAVILVALPMIAVLA